MISIGICGGIGTGKTTITNICEDIGYPVFYSDAVVAKSYKQPEVVSLIKELAPASVIDNTVSKPVLTALAFQDTDLLSKLEKIIHPLVYKEAVTFIKEQETAGTSLAFIEAPLMFTSDIHRLCTYTIALTGSKEIQKARVLERDGMTTEKFETLYCRQLREMNLCRQNAHFTINTNGTKTVTKDAFNKVLKKITSSHQITLNLSQRQQGE